MIYMKRIKKKQRKNTRITSITIRVKNTLMKIRRFFCVCVLIIKRQEMRFFVFVFADRFMCVCVCIFENVLLTMIRKFTSLLDSRYY